MLNLNITSDCGETPNSNRAQHLPWLECKNSLVRKYWSLNKFLVSSHSCEHDDLIMKYFFRIIATLAGLVAAYAIWQDLTSSYSASAPLGRLWYLYSPTTLQAAESIISRYVDPCGLITALDCFALFMASDYRHHFRLASRLGHDRIQHHILVGWWLIWQTCNAPKKGRSRAQTTR